MGLDAGLNVALSGMKVAQSQLELVGKNIANIDTEGYTRKTAASQSVVLAGYNSGVSLSDTTREVSEGLLRSYLSSSSLDGALSTKSEYLDRTQMLLGTPESSNSISTNVSNLQSAFATFSTDVASSAGRFNLVNEASSLTSRLNYLTEEIQKLRGDADLAISGAVDTINSTLSELDELNEEIVKYSVLGYEGTADLMDKRDQALRELSSMIEIDYFTRANGEIVVQTTGGATLLDKDPHYLSHQPIAQTSPSASYAGGAINGISVDGQDITATIKGGEIQGLVEVRDTILPSLQSQLDELTGVIVSEVNAAHNKGTAFPAGSYELSGSRTFISPNTQQIGISNGDVRISIFDADGTQVDTTTLVAEIGFNNGTISDMAQEIENWMVNEAGLPQASVSVDADGKFNITTGDSQYYISFMDVQTAAAGSPTQDVDITFDIGQGTTREFEGFSSFLGLNDFFVSPRGNESVYDSKVINKTVNLGVTAANPTVLNFYGSNGSNAGSVTIFPNDTLTDVVNKINDLDSNLIASLVPNGNGFVFRVEDMSGDQLEITDGGSGFIQRLGLEPSVVGISSDVAVREDILQNSNKIAAGQPVFNEDIGEYQLNQAENSVANAMSDVFKNTQDFGEAGNVSSTETTLAKYASTFVGSIATQASSYKSELAYQSELTSSISMKEAQLGGVDMDQELSQLIVYQQTYAACAQAFTASKEMLDTLFGMMQ